MWACGFGSPTVAARDVGRGAVVELHEVPERRRQEHAVRPVHAREAPGAADLLARRRRELTTLNALLTRTKTPPKSSRRRCCMALRFSVAGQWSLDCDIMLRLQRYNTTLRRQPDTSDHPKRPEHPNQGETVPRGAAHLPPDVSAALQELGVAKPTGSLHLPAAGCPCAGRAVDVRATHHGVSPVERRPPCPSQQLRMGEMKKPMQ